MSKQRILGNCEKGDQVKLTPDGMTWAVIHKNLNGGQFDSIIVLENEHGNRRTCSGLTQRWIQPVFEVKSATEILQVILDDNRKKPRKLYSTSIVGDPQCKFLVCIAASPEQARGKFVRAQEKWNITINETILVQDLDANPEICVGLNKVKSMGPWRAVP